MKKRNKKASINFAAFLAYKVGLATEATFAIIILVVLGISFKTIYTSATKNADSAIEETRSEVEKIFSHIEAEAQVLQISFSDLELSQDYLLDITKKIVENEPSILSCAVAYEPFVFSNKDEYYMPCSYVSNGVVTSKVMGSQDFDYFYQNWYQIPKLTGKPNWNDPEYDFFGSGEIISSYSFPFYDLNGIFIGVIRMDMAIDPVADLVNKSQHFKHSATLVVSKSGQFASHTQKERILCETIMTEPIENGNEMAIERCQAILSGERGNTVYLSNGRLYYSAFAPFDNGWAIVGLCDYRYIFANLISLVFTLLVLLFIGLTILYFVNEKLISRLTKPIAELSLSAMNMSRGNFHATIPDVGSKDELKQLETSMRYLQTSINQYITALKDSTVKKERIESELNIAKAIQMAFLSKEFPIDKDFECYALMSPAKEVGGDLYDFRKEGNMFKFAVGDVSGKGVPAALFMALARSAFSVLKNMNLSCRDTVAKINDSFAEGNESGMFVTLFYAQINLDTMEMEYCNGGHNPIIIINPDGTAQFLHAKPNLAVGLFADFQYKGEKIQLQKGCRIIAYTDGVTEAEDFRKNLYGEERLMEYALKLPKDSTSQETVTGLFENVKAFTNGNEQNDDITIFSVKV